MAEGVGVGFEQESDNGKKDIESSLFELTNKMKATVDIESQSVGRQVLTNKGDAADRDSNSYDQRVSIHIDEINLDKDRDVESFLEEVAFHLKQKSFW